MQNLLNTLNLLEKEKDLKQPIIILEN